VRSGHLYRDDRLYVPNDAGLKTRLMHECHDVPLAGHLGVDKTIGRVKQRFYWPGMDAEIERYVTSCDACQRNKPSQQAPMGLMMPLRTPDRPWQWVSLDLITQLPRSRHGHDAIVVFVCRLTKMVHFVATRTAVSSVQLAEIFLREVVRLHGVPQYILSDRDPRFTAKFWRAFWSRLGTTLTMSTAYHPQSDGQTERANRTLEEMLRSRVNFEQDDWEDHLSAAELAYNSSVQASSGFSPFFLNNGREPEMPIDHALADGAPQPPDNPVADERAARLRSVLDEVKRNLSAAQQRQARYADRHRRDVTFAVGDAVLLSTANLKFVDSDRRTPKLASKYIGPFKVTRVKNNNSYELDLPPQMNVHPVFNIDRLKPYRDGNRLFPDRPSPFDRPPPEIAREDGAEVFEVERILAKRGRADRAEYLVLWRGYPLHEATWEPRSALDGALQAIGDFESQQ
jgi:transposase InsO family protein